MKKPWLYDLVPGNMLAANLKDGEVTTAHAQKVKIKIGGAKVFTTHVMANNGEMRLIG